MSVSVIPIFDVGDYDNQIAAAAERLRAGGTVVLPTETVYGLAGRLGAEPAMSRLRAMRSSDEDRPFTIHLAKREDAREYLGPVSEIGGRLMKKLWPGPVALTFDVPAERRAEVSARLGMAESILYEHDGTITLRCPDHVVARDVIGRAGGPIALTQARQPQRDDPMTDLEGKADLAFDAGPTRYHKPSTIVRVRGDKYEIARAGVYDERIIERLLRTTVLFVCSGNTCRSPMAEALARQILASRLNVAPDELEKRGVTIASAGSFALPGARATPQAVEAVKSLGADLSRHRSRPLTVELIHQADVVFAMGNSHVSAVKALVPSASEKTFSLNPDGEIADPIGGNVAHYEELAGQLKILVEKQLQEKVLSAGGI